MLEVELDIFSGRPNPTWMLSEKEEKQLMERVLAEPKQLAAVDSPDEALGLGYRGFIIRQAKPDTGPWSTMKRPAGVRFATELKAPRGLLPLEFRVGTRAGKGTSVADFLLRSSEREGEPVTDAVREVVRGGVSLIPQVKGPTAPPARARAAPAPRAPKDIGVEGGTWWACPSAYYNANAHVFNDPYYVARNNCYCFASNHLANSRYALPGRRGGRPATSITCAGVIAGLRADGWVDTCQVNTLTIAMVIWPGVDYHFYRVVTGGPAWWWGHKPGGTPAKYTDNSGRSLANGLSPYNCNRGAYTDFCGYFYQNNNTAFVA